MVDRWNSCSVLAVERLGPGRGRLGRDRPRRLGRVADDGPGGGAAAPADHPPLHRGEVLRLVDQDVRERVVLDPVRRRGPGPAGRGVLAVRRGGQLLQVGADVVVELVVVLVPRGHVAERVAQLVEQRHVLHGQRAVAAPRLGEQPLVLRRDHALADPGEEVGVAQPRRAPRARPAAATTRPRTSRNAWFDSISSLNASRPRSRPRSPLTWRHMASSRVVAIRGSWRLRRPCDISWRRSRPSSPRSSVITSSRQKIRNSFGLPGACCRAVRRISSAIRCRALHVGDGRLVVAGGADAVDDLAERPQRDRGLAERRQHPLDVAHEHAARADDQHAATLVAAAVGVEEVRRAVQRDDRLAGAGAAGDRHDALAGRADRLVLLGLDGRDDRVHGPVTGPRELRHQRALADDRQVGLDTGVEQLVLDPDHLAGRCSAAPGGVRRRGGSAAVAW